MWVPISMGTNMAAGNGKKHLEFTFVRREVCFLLWTFENLDKYFSLYLHCLECWKSPAESFWRCGTALPQRRPPMPRTMKIWKLKLFYFQKNARYRAKELCRDIFLGNLSIKECKISVGLPVLILEFWWRHVKTKNTLLSNRDAKNTICTCQWIVVKYFRVVNQRKMTAISEESWERVFRAVKKDIRNS